MIDRIELNETVNKIMRMKARSQPYATILIKIYTEYKTIHDLKYLRGLSVAVESLEKRNTIV